MWAFSRTRVAQHVFVVKPLTVVVTLPAVFDVLLIGIITQHLQACTQQMFPHRENGRE